MVDKGRRRRVWRYAVGAALLAAAVLTWGGCQMFDMPGKSFSGPLPALKPGERALAGALREHVATLAGKIGERHTRRPAALEKAAAYIEGTLIVQGWAPAGQEYEAGGEGGKVRNIEIEIPGSTRREEIVVVGAHYDSVPGCPGANDNATGIAALLELARAFHGKKPARTLRFVAFVNEEPPYFHGSLMGSLVYARRCAQRKEKVVGMLALETMGYYSEAPGSQHYPGLAGMIYPDTGNFISFVGNFASRDLVHRCVGSFRRHTAFPSEGGAIPEIVEGVGWSDHWSFWQCGYPALMVTDTAPFRYAHYHTAADTPEKIDYEKLARVTAGVGRVVEELLEK